MTDQETSDKNTADPAPVEELEMDITDPTTFKRQTTEVQELTLEIPLHYLVLQLKEAFNLTDQNITDLREVLIDGVSHDVGGTVKVSMYCQKDTGDSLNKFVRQQEGQNQRLTPFGQPITDVPFDTSMLRRMDGGGYNPPEPNAEPTAQPNTVTREDVEPFGATRIFPNTELAEEAQRMLQADLQKAREEETGASLTPPVNPSPFGQ